MNQVILPNNVNVPTDLDSAIAIIEKNTSAEDIEYAKSVSEKQFSGQAHFSFGRNLRNNWHLWWNKKLAADHKDTGYPQEKPAIVEFFNKHGIYHADDMSGIIVTSFYRHLVGLDRDFDAQVKKYVDFWGKKGLDMKQEMEG